MRWLGMILLRQMPPAGLGLAPRGLPAGGRRRTLETAALPGGESLGRLGMVLHTVQMPPWTRCGHGLQGMVLPRMQMPPNTEPGPGVTRFAGGKATGCWAAGAARLVGRGMVLRKQMPLAH